MIKLLPKKRTPAALLGLTLDGSRIDGVLLRRSNGSLQVLKSFSSTLTLNLLNGEPELVGREIRNHLEQAGIRERRCTVCVPLGWAMTLGVRLPELSEADLPSFLQIEAERGFPYGLDALSMSTSQCKTVSGTGHATLVAVPRNHLEQLEAVLKAAQLRPTSFSLGITALQGAEKNPSDGVVALAIGENAVELQITSQGGLAALRSLEDVIETEGVQKRLNLDRLICEIRVTLGQLSDDLRGSIRKVRVFGSTDAAQRLAQDLVGRVAPLGLQVEPVRAYAADEFRSRLPAETPVSPAISVAARQLTGVPCSFEFLPPKISALQRLTARFSSRKLGWMSGAAAGIVLLIGAAIASQQWQLSQLRSQWSDMSREVTDLEAMQQQVRQFRPWFDESFRSLSILRRVTEAFPEDGSVTAKLVEIRDESTVSCSGLARDNQSFLKMLDQLRSAREVGNVKVDQVRGKTPLQFNLNFQWAQGGTSEN
jgi:hypothetical protein